MMSQGINIFIEVGPGKTLNGFLRKISRDIKGYNVQDMASLEKTLQGLEDAI
jgi:[acyl-carrier-protein] S-malonyltransferase